LCGQSNSGMEIESCFQYEGKSLRVQCLGQW
jgi:hypothetical protein